MKYGKRILLAVAVVFLSFFCLDLAAEQMPERAPEELAGILAQERFQPRSVPESFVTRFWRAVRDALLSKAKEIWDSIKNTKLPLPEVNLPSGWIQALKDFLEGLVAVLRVIGEFLCACLSYAVYLLCFVALLLLIWIGGKFLRKRVKGFSSSDELLRAGSTQDLTEEIPSLEGLLAKEKYLEALAALKAIWRRQFTGQYAFSPALTDRSMSRQLPEFEQAKGFFREVVACFEKYVFAGEPVEEEVVKTLYRQNQELIEEQL